MAPVSVGPRVVGATAGEELVAVLLDTGGVRQAPDPASAAVLLGLAEEGTYTVLAVTSVVERHPEDTAPGGLQPGAARPELPEGVPVWWYRAHAIVGLSGPAGLAEFVRAVDPPSGTRVGIGPAVTGAGALPRARVLAERALRAAPDAPVAVLEEKLPAALVADSPDLAALLVARALGPVLELPVQDRDSLLNTLRAWLEAGGSTRRAGDRLFYHPNTVLNRLRRYEQLTGRLLGEPATVVELTLALEAHRLSGVR